MVSMFQDIVENEEYLKKQIITYIGNKRELLQFIEKGIYKVKNSLNKTKLDMFDVFSGSGIVARYFKQHANNLYANDMELYSKIINNCYLSNVSSLNIKQLKEIYNQLLQHITQEKLQGGLISSLYAPLDDDNIKAGERVFYTKRNAMYIDTMRNLIQSVDSSFQNYFLAPLITEASIHANTSGVFKGFYKDRYTGIGQFGGSRRNSIFRIKGDIKLPFPIFSNFDCNVSVFNGDSNMIVKEIPEVDLAYLDPPYNQHPYGSNYFMLNLIAENKKPLLISNISGIPNDWNRSAYNKKQYALSKLTKLVTDLKSKYVLISFNSEGFISFDEMKNMLNKIGSVEILETKYNTFRACRNLANRKIHVTEYLYLLEK
ncbi:MAG: DNA adenine methylase [Termitinemataceae bacterium]|nr:MAG: DNA adenine methylase [Termitinemataceae bacterium]